MDDGCHVGMCWCHQTENEEILLMEEIPNNHGLDV